MVGSILQSPPFASVPERSFSAVLASPLYMCARTEAAACPPVYMHHCGCVCMACVRNVFWVMSKLAE